MPKLETPATLQSNPKDEATKLESFGRQAMVGDAAALSAQQLQLNSLASASPEYFRAVNNQLQIDSKNMPHDQLLPALTLTLNPDTTNDRPKAFLSMKSPIDRQNTLEPLILMAAGSPVAMECQTKNTAPVSCNLEQTFIRT